MVAVLDPLLNVAMHVVEAEVVGLTHCKRLAIFKPNWLVDALKKGGKMDDFTI